MNPLNITYKNSEWQYSVVRMGSPEIIQGFAVLFCFIYLFVKSNTNSGIEVN